MFPGFQIRWKNFRSFADTGWIEIKPVTIVIGSNNSGKTSLHAPLLLLKQTNDSQDPSAALVAAGDLVDVGAFNDAVHCHQDDKKIEFNVRWDQVWNPSRKRGPLGAERPGSCRWDFTSGGDLQDVLLHQVTIRDIYERPILTRRRMKSGKYSISNFPQKLRTGKSAVERAMVTAVKSAQPYGFLFSESDAERAGQFAQAEQARTKKAGTEFFKLPTPPGLDLYQAVVGYTERSVERVLSEIYYIGPIRERLRRFYEVSSERPRSVGIRGEDAPQLIYRWRHDGDRMGELEQWLGRFGFNQQLEVHQQGPYAFSLLLKRARATPRLGFVDLGFGVSQVLPLIVQGVNAQAGDLIIAEQPEIHLNPALQAELADLFVHFATEHNLWNYIETHSEHLLLRLRRLVAENRIDADAVAVYYVERDGQKSSVRRIPIGSDGSVAQEVWPDGFFGESLRDAIGLAEAQMRRNDSP